MRRPAVIPGFRAGRGLPPVLGLSGIVGRAGSQPTFLRVPSMSGHSKWANIKHKKGAMDAKKGAVFTKLARELTVTTRQGGSGDPETNHRLRLAIDRAKQANMPHDNIERAIKKGLGAPEDGTALEEAVYEGYGPGGAAILVQSVTDNRNRTSSEVRALFTRAGGNLGAAGSVAWLFENKAIISVEGANDAKAEELALAAIDAGAEDFEAKDSVLEIWGPPSSLESMQQTLRIHGAEPASSTVTMLPQTTTRLDDSAGVQTLRLLEKLEDLEDVSHVFTNAEFPDEVLEKYQPA